jgi:hypothetical protein
MSRHSSTAPDAQPKASLTLTNTQIADRSYIDMKEYQVLNYQYSNGFEAKDNVGIIDITKKSRSYYRYKYINNSAPNFHHKQVSLGYIITPTGALTTALDSYKNRVFSDFNIIYGKDDNQLELDNTMCYSFIKDVLIKAIAYKSAHVILMVESHDDEIRVIPKVYVDHQIKDNKYYSIYQHLDKNNRVENYVIEFSYEQIGESYQYSYNIVNQKNSSKSNIKEVQNVINEWNEKLLNTNFKPFEFELYDYETSDVVGSTLTLYHQLDDYISQRDQEYILGMTDKYVNESSINEDKHLSGLTAGVHKMFQFNSLGGSQAQVAIISQPSIRAQEHQQRIETTQSMIAHSMKLPSEEIFKSFNNSTATGINAQSNMTVEQVKSFNELFRDKMSDLIKSYYLIMSELKDDKEMFNSIIDNFELVVPEYLESNVKDITQVVSQMTASNMISKFETVRRLNPDYSDDQIEFETLTIKFENDLNMTSAERIRATELGILDVNDEGPL